MCLTPELCCWQNWRLKLLEWDGSEAMKSMHILSLDHFSSVIFRHDIVYLQLRGALSTLFITSPDWNWSLWLRATGKEMDLIRCWGAASMLCCHLQNHRLFIYSSKDSVMWGWRGGTNIMPCLILWALRQSRHHPNKLFWSAEVVPVSIVCQYSAIELLFSRVVMSRGTVYYSWSLWASYQGLSQILTYIG